MVIKFNQTKSRIACAPADVRKQITESILGNIGSGGCDPHGNPMYDHRSSSYSGRTAYSLDENESLDYSAASTSTSCASRPQESESFDDAYSIDANDDNNNWSDQPEHGTEVADTAIQWFSDSSTNSALLSQPRPSDEEESYVRSVKQPHWFSDVSSQTELEIMPDNSEQAAQPQATPWCAPPSADICQAPQTSERHDASSCFVEASKADAAECFRIDQFESETTQENSSSAMKWFDTLRTREFEVSIEPSTDALPLDTSPSPEISEVASNGASELFDLIAEASMLPIAAPATTWAPSANLPELSAANAGISRTQRGTIEFIMHPTGTAIKPQYNLCGILLAVHFNDGSSIVRANGPTPWVVLDPNGNEVPELQVLTLSMDRKGSVIYVTADGSRMTIFSDGTVKRVHAA